MLALIIKRILQAIPVLFIVVTVTFFLVRLAPGGPFDTDKAVAPEVMEALREAYNLNAPMHQQYFEYLANLVRGELGPSYKFPSRTVNEIIAESFPVTVELALYAITLAIFIGMPLGIIAAVKSNTWLDYLPMSVAMIGICLPSMLLGPLLILSLGIYFNMFPVSGWGYLPGDKMLPALTLASAYGAYIARITRSGMLEVLSQDYIRTARAKGLSAMRVILVHALRGGVSPVVSFLGPAFAGLLAGSFVVETVFQIPGLGRFFVQAAFNRDYTMILGTTIFFAFVIIMCNLAADILLIFLNPKLRKGNTAN